MMSSASPSSQCGRRVQAAPSAPVASCARRLAPGADRDVRLLAADRDVGVGGVRDPQQQVVELGLGGGQLGVDRVDPLAGARWTARAARRPRGRPGLAPPRIASPICLRRRVALGLEGVGLGLEPAPRRVDLDRPVDDGRVLALVDRALPDPVRLLAEPLHADAHAIASRELAGLAQAADHEAAVEARQQPAGTRPVGPAEEREVEGVERGLGVEAVVRGDGEDRRLPLLAGRGRVAVGGLGQGAQEAALLGAELARPRPAARRAGSRSGRARGRTPRASGGRPPRRTSSSAASASVSGAPLLGRDPRRGRRRPGPGRAARGARTPAGRRRAACSTSAAGSSSE